MTRNEILEIANKFYTNGGVTEREIAFARFMMAQEREACAKVCEKNANDFSEGDWDPACISCADHIRARGNK